MMHQMSKFNYKKKLNVTQQENTVNTRSQRPYRAGTTALRGADQQVLRYPAVTHRRWLTRDTYDRCVLLVGLSHSHVLKVPIN